MEPNSGIPGKMNLARRITLILWDLDSILHRVDVMPSEAVEHRIFACFVNLKGKREKSEDFEGRGEGWRR